MIATTIDYQKLYDWRANVYIAISGFGRCRSRLGSVSSRWAWSKTQICRRNCHPICHSSRDFRFCWRHYHFQLSVIVAITWRYFIQARHRQKSRTCHWNFDAICCSSGGISTSGLGGHIVSGCPSLSHLFLGTFFWSLVWSKTLCRARITVILILQIY